MRNYLKCVWANKFTFTGWVLLIGGFISLFLFISFKSSVNDELLPTLAGLLMLSLVLGLGLLAATIFGFHTLDAYQRAVHVYKQRACAKVLANMVKDESAYCSRVGIRLALNEVRNEKRRS